MIEIDGAEARNAQGSQGLATVPADKDLFDRTDGSFRIGRVDDLLVDDILMRTREDADAFRAAQLYSRIEAAAHAVPVAD